MFLYYLAGVGVSGYRVYIWCLHFLGWGWVVVLSSFIIHVIVDGITYSFGVLFIALLDDFKGGKGESAWILSIFVGMTLGTGTVLCNACMSTHAVNTTHSPLHNSILDSINAAAAAPVLSSQCMSEADRMCIHILHQVTSILLKPAVIYTEIMAKFLLVRAALNPITLCKTGLLKSIL